MVKRAITLVLLFVSFQSYSAWYHAVYAEYLYYLAKHSHNTFHDHSSRIVIGVYGSTEMYEATKQMSMHKSVNGKVIQVDYMTSLSDFENYHIVFFNNTKSEELLKAATLCKKHHVILASDIYNSITRGSDLEFFKDAQGNIKYKIGKQKEGIRLSSVLVNMAMNPHD